jgi:hypothetical protein
MLWAFLGAHWLVDYVIDQHVALWLLALWPAHLRPLGLALLAEGICGKNLAVSPFHIAGRRKKSSSVLMSAWKPWKLIKNFSFN